METNLKGYKIALSARGANISAVGRIPHPTTLSKSPDLFARNFICLYNQKYYGVQTIVLPQQMKFRANKALVEGG